MRIAVEAGCILKRLRMTAMKKAWITAGALNRP
jgi:hypothetical protein